jgi:hypothetical protein
LVPRSGRQEDRVAGAADLLAGIPDEVQPAADDYQDLVHRVGVEMMNLASGVMLQFDAALYGWAFTVGISKPIFRLGSCCAGMQLDRTGLRFPTFLNSRLHSRSAAANVRCKQGPKI